MGIPPWLGERCHFDESVVVSDSEGTRLRGLLDTLDERTYVLEHSGWPVEHGQPVRPLVPVRAVKDRLADTESHGAFTGHEGRGVEEGTQLGNGAPRPPVDQLGEGPMVVGKRQDLGYAPVTANRMDQREERARDDTGNVVVGPGLMPDGVSLDGHRSSSNPSGVAHLVQVRPPVSKLCTSSCSFSRTFDMLPQDLYP